MSEGVDWGWVGRMGEKRNGARVVVFSRWEEAMVGRRELSEWLMRARLNCQVGSGE